MNRQASRTVLLLPGMMCDDRLFAYQRDRLIQDTAGQISVLIPPLHTATSMTELAAQVLNAAPPSFCLCGLSMGGILAMEITAQAPHRVDRLALMDTNPLAETADGTVRRNRQIADVKSGGLKQVMADEMKPLYLADSPDKAALLKLCMDMALSLGEAAFINQSLALRDRPDQTETLKSVRCPTLILHGAEDRLCPPERHHLMHQLIPHATLVAVQNAGHLPPLEAPQDTYGHLKDWLQQPA